MTVTDPSDRSSRAYWDDRFTRDWERNDGPRQSRRFAELALARLPPWFLDVVRRDRLSVVDWGCAQGDGTAAWRELTAPGRLAGVDFSPVAIEQARARAPEIRFLAEDWLAPSVAGGERFDVVFSSNTLEHFAQPFAVLDVIAARAQRAAVVMVPYRERDRHPEHAATIEPDAIPSALANGFALIAAQVIDCTAVAHSPWSGEQIVLVYADRAWSAPHTATLDRIELQTSDARSDRARLEGTLAALAARDQRVVQLETALATADQRAGEAQAALAQLELRVRTLDERHAARLSTRLYRLGRELTGRWRGR